MSSMLSSEHLRELIKAQVRLYLTQKVVPLNTILTNVDLSCMVAIRADLSSTVLKGSNLWGADLRGADLSDADLSDTNLSDTDLRGAKLSGANLSGANLSGARLDCADMSFTDLTHTNFTHASLVCVNFNRSTLSCSSYTTFNHCDCSGATFQETGAEEVNFYSCDMSGVEM